MELPAGKIHEGQHELTLTTKGEIRTVAQLRKLVVTARNGAIIHLSDVADVEDTVEDATSYSAMSGKQALALVVTKQSGANSVEVSRLVRNELVAMQPLLDKAHLTATVPTDQAPFIEHSIEDVQFDLMFGAALAVLIILFFLHDIRATIISAVALPTAVVATFAFIQVMGFTFNNMTMLALSLSIGILIDDAIVVIENIHRHLEMGKPALQAASDATREIGLAVIATTFSIVAVFLPVAVMKGIIGRFFFQFGLTVSFAVLVSLLVAFTLTPMLSSRFLKSNHGKPPGVLARPIEWFLRGIDKGYRRLLAAALRHRAITVVLAVVTLFGSCKLAGQVKAEFLPPQDRAQFRINVELPVGTSLEATSAYSEVVASDMRKALPGVLDTFVTVGDGAQNQVNIGKIQVLMVKRTERPFGQRDAMAWARERYKDVKDATITVEEIGDIEGGGFKNAPIQYNIRGRDPAELEATAKAMMAALRKEKGFVDVDSSFRGGKPELEITPDRARAAALGVPVAAIATTVRDLVAGDKVSELKEGLDTYDITVAMPEQNKNDVASLTNLQVRSASGAPVDLANVVTVKRGEGPSQIDRQSRSRQITVYANLEGVPLGEATKVVDRVAKEVVPPDLESDYAGMGQVMAESFGYMFAALILAIIIVYMILAAQFNSFIHPLTIMLSLPMAVVGAFGGLYATGMTLNIFSMIGLIMLMGLVTKNAILLVDYANQQIESGKSVLEALMAAGPVRLRPILMTTAAMIFGMLPVALALGEGGEQRAPMAVVVMGGLITSTVLTLVVVPVVYSLFEGARRRLFKKKYAAQAAAAADPDAHAPA
jgi:HAE1 family hydrophobic/amphiphilic exporter-1